MLLVDHDEAEVAEGDIILEQRVGADGDLPGAAREPAQGPASRLALVAAGQQLGPEVQAGEEGRDDAVVLARQDLRRRHDRGLGAGLHRGQHRGERDHGLAAADVALQQAQHPVRPPHIGQNLGDRALLCPGHDVGQGLAQAGEKGAVARQNPALAPPRRRADQHQGQLVGEQLVIGQALANRRLGRRRRELVGRVGGNRGD